MVALPPEQTACCNTRGPYKCVTVSTPTETQDRIQDSFESNGLNVPVPTWMIPYFPKTDRRAGCYREFATSVAELRFDALTPLNDAILEFANVGQKVGHNVGQTE